MKKIILLTIFFLFLIGCGNNGDPKILSDYKDFNDCRIDYMIYEKGWTAQDFISVEESALSLEKLLSWAGDWPMSGLVCREIMFEHNPDFLSAD